MTTSNEQKVTSNEQKVTSNKQRVTINGQKVTSNKQRAKTSASLKACFNLTRLLKTRNKKVLKNSQKNNIKRLLVSFRFSYSDCFIQILKKNGSGKKKNYC